MPKTTTQMADHFSLAHFLGGLEGFTPPTGPFDPSGSWRHGYHMLMSVGKVTRQGMLIVERTPLADGTARLQVECTKRASGGTQRYVARLLCGANALSGPISWELETYLLDTEGKAIADSRLEETGRAVDGGLEVSTGGKTRRLVIPGAFTLHWSLLDAVQRLPGDDGAPLSFTLIDRLNCQAKPGHILAFAEEATIELGGRPVWDEQKQELEAGTLYRPVQRRLGAVATNLRCYEQTGTGILPTFYWVDERGELLVVSSGLIAYIHAGEGGT